MDHLRVLIILSLFGTIGATREWHGSIRTGREYRREKFCGPDIPQLRENPLLVETQNGKVQGVESVSRSGKKFAQFLGIPYGQPPEGNLRFESPKPVGNWEGVLNATEYRKFCAYYDFLNAMHNGVEDCLYLNVLTPLIGSNDKLLPVFVYIHGLSFLFGGAELYKGGYFMDHNIVFVSMDYRVEAFGFLNTNDDLIRGNMGLKDQNLALQWVQQNIRKFGGDPDLVTISGTSFGAISVNHHIFSPKSTGLFSKAIMMSGSNLTPGGIMPAPKATTDWFISKVNCTAGSRKDEVACLKNLNTSQLLDAYKDIDLNAPAPFQLLFFASKEIIQDDDAFITEDPLEVLKSGNFSKVPVILGLAEFELEAVTAILSFDTTGSIQARDNFSAWAPENLRYEKDDTISDEIKQFYFRGNTTDIFSDVEKTTQTTKLFSDRMFFTGVDKFAKLYSQHAPVFLYYHAWKPDLKLSFADNLSGSHKKWAGNSHGDDSLLLFKRGEIKLDKGSRIYKLSEDLVQLWTQFCNEEWMSFRGVPWWQNNPNGKNLTFLKIDEIPELVQDPFKNRMDFWEGIEQKIKKA